MNLNKESLEQQIKFLFGEWLKIKQAQPLTKVRYAGPKLGSEEYESILDALFNDWWSGGNFTVTAERDLAKINERKYGLLTNSGSSANLIMMSAAKELYFNDGDTILTLACGFPTTVNPIIQNNLIPKFVDIDIDTLNLSPGVLRKQLEADKNIKGVFVAHTLGFKSNVSEILDIAREHNVQVFFDCCDAYGTRYQDKLLPYYGKAATFSFYVAHHITMGEGGGVVTNDDDLNLYMRSFKSWGRFCASPNCCIRSLHPNSFCPTAKLTRSTELPPDYITNYQYEFLGYNLKPLEIQSAMLIQQLKKLEDFTNQRQSNYKKLYGHLKKYDKYFQIWEIDADVSPFGFPMLIKPGVKFTRSNFVNHMTINNIETRMLFGGNLTKHPAYTKKSNLWTVGGNLDNSDIIMNNFVMLGVSQILDDNNIQYVCDKIDSFIKEWK